MSSKGDLLIDARIAAQPGLAGLLPLEDRDRLIISSVRVNGAWVIRSLYGNDTWVLKDGATNRSPRSGLINFNLVPTAFRAITKEVLYAYLRRGRDGAAKPSHSTMFRIFFDLLPFLRYLDALKLKHLAAVTPMVCANYVAACRSVRQTRKKCSPPLSAGALERRFIAVEMFYEMSQYTETPIPANPWPETSAMLMTGRTRKQFASKTPLMPDDVFSTLFQAAWALVQGGDAMLDLRERLDEVALNLKGRCQRVIKDAKCRYLKAHGWKGGLRKFTEALNELRTACYIVVACLSGCRNHELAYVQSGAYYCTEDDEGEVYWWMRSQSDKTGAGKTEWMIPEAAVKALRVMDRWAIPLQAMVANRVAQLNAANPKDPDIADLQRHSGAVFLGFGQKLELVRTLSNAAWNLNLKNFVKRCNLKWSISTHQFRRKFASYAARSQFGDLRYLREHFKHWSQDMTNDGYALNESQEMELYAEIQDELDAIKLGLAEQWLNPDEPLAGGYGRNLMDWRSREENIAIYKDHKTMVASVAQSHAIRSNGHAWCTADDQGCIGNTLEKTRCSGCDNAVIGRFHARTYQRLYDGLRELAQCDDIGPGGQARVLRDLGRCRDVLISLGYDPEAKKAA